MIFKPGYYVLLLFLLTSIILFSCFGGDGMSVFHII